MKDQDKQTENSEESDQKEEIEWKCSNLVSQTSVSAPVTAIPNWTQESGDLLPSLTHKGSPFHLWLDKRTLISSPCRASGECDGQDRCGQVPLPTKLWSCAPEKKLCNIPLKVLHTSIGPVLWPRRRENYPREWELWPVHELKNGEERAPMLSLPTRALRHNWASAGRRKNKLSEVPSFDYLGALKIHI